MSESVSDEVGHNINAERALLGALIYHHGAIDRVTQEILPDDMVLPMNKKLFDLILKMHGRGITVDPTSLIVYLGETPGLPATFQAYVMSVIEDRASIENVNYYANEVKSKSIMRSLVSRAAEIPSIVDDRSISASDKLEQIGKSIMDVIDLSASKATDSRIIGDILPDHINAIEMRVTGDPSIIATTFSELDRTLCGGLRTTQFVIIGGRPSMGKTTLGMNIIRGIAVDNRISCGVLSMEMGRIQLIDKLVSDIGSIEYNTIRSGALSNDDYERYALALSRMQDSPLVIDDESGLSIADVERKARIMKRKHNIRVLMVDYIQMIRGEKSILGRADQVENISARLKILAKKLDICVLGLAQLNRGADKENRPSLAQLRNSGSLEQDADVVIFPYREEKDNPDTDKKGMAEIIIGKQREGETGVVISSLFDGHYARFREHPSMYREC